MFKIENMIKIIRDISKLFTKKFLVSNSIFLIFE